jgi:hypothetical protein
LENLIISDRIMKISTKTSEVDMAVTWYAIIRLADGNQQRVEVHADRWHSARLMIEAQFGRNSIISGPHRLDLMRVR